jgi:hypothetical protein
MHPGSLVANVIPRVYRHQSGQNFYSTGYKHKYKTSSANLFLHLAAKWLLDLHELPQTVAVYTVNPESAIFFDSLGVGLLTTTVTSKRILCGS